MQHALTFAKSTRCEDQHCIPDGNNGAMVQTKYPLNCHLLLPRRGAGVCGFSIPPAILFGDH